MRAENRQQLLIIVALAVVGFFAVDRLVLTPLGKAWKYRQTRIQELRVQLEQGKTLLDRESQVRSSWEHVRRNSLPRNTSAAEQQLFKAIDQWAQDSRVSVNAITPLWKRDSDDFMTLQCRVDASGNLPAISRFLFNIEKNAMALKLDSVEIGSRDKEGQALSMGLQLSALVLTPGNTR